MINATTDMEQNVTENEIFIFISGNHSQPLYDLSL